MLQAIVLLLSQLNECFACFNPWIVISPRGLDGLKSWRHALCLALLYAVIETIALRGMQTSAIPPWVFAWCLSPLGAFSAFYFFVCLPELELAEGSASKKDKGETLIHSQQHHVKSAVALLPCVLTTAVMNAAFLLFGQSLYASWIQQRYHVTHVFGPLAVLVNLACHYIDFEIYKRTGRPLTLRELSCFSVYGPAVVYLAELFVARLFMRIMIGIEPFLAFHGLEAAEADAMYPEPV